MPQIVTGNAIILASRPMNEADAFLEIFSEQEGKITVVAKGIKKKESRLCGILQPFFCITYERLGTHQKSEKIPILIRASLLKKPETKISTFVFLSLCSEISRRFLVENQVLPEIFHLWNDFIEIPIHKKMSVIGFLFRFFKILGILPSYKHCHGCEKIFTEKNDSFVYCDSLEGVFHASCAPLKSIKIPFLLLKTISFATLSPLKKTICIRLQAFEEDFILGLLFSVVRIHSPIPLKSVEIWESISREYSPIVEKKL